MLFRSKRGDIDGAIMDIGNAFDLEKRGEGRILVRFTDIKDFHIHVIFATNKVIAERPAAVRAFLAGWFDTIKRLDVADGDRRKIFSGNAERLLKLKLS